MTVMAGLGAVISDFILVQDVGARHKAGHDSGAKRTCKVSASS
jgi:hypothetical protein